MRTPIRSETEAFWFAIVGAAVIVVAILVGLLIEPWAGAAVIAVAIVIGLIAYLRAPNPERRAPLRSAAQAPHPHGARTGARHVLVIANQALSGGELAERLLDGDGEHVEVDILAPVLTSRVHYGMSDIDHELRDARERLERSLAWAREQGIAARGEVGDPNPSVAIEDELRDFGAQEVIVLTHPAGQETWQERDELERLRRELDVPVTLFAGGEADRGEVHSADSREQREGASDA